MNQTRVEIEKMINDDNLSDLLHRTAMMHGHHCVGSAMGVIAGHYAMKSLNVDENTGMEHLIAVVETNSCFSDGVQMVTGCSFGNNSLVYRDYGKTAFSLIRRGGEGVRVSLRPDIGDLLKDNRPESKSFTKLINERKATPEEEAQIMKLNMEHCFNVLDVPAEKIFKLEPANIELPSYSRILQSHICTRCGEKIMASKAVTIDDKYFCIPCAGASYNQLDWSGLHHVENPKK